MSKQLVTILGKTVKKVAALRGGGSALPGLVVEKIDPDFVSHTLSNLPYGIVVISGTNGKTTTTKMVVELLESCGLRVFTNRTGSNFVRGVIAALLGEINIYGKLNADIAVLELDEAHAVNFVDKIQPDHCLILNVMRDQLDRFGEIDHTTNLLRHVANNTKKTVVLNSNDPQIAPIGKSLSNKNVIYFGLSDKLSPLFPSDEDLHSIKHKHTQTIKPDVTLNSFQGSTADYIIDNKTYSTSLKITGIYNIFNAAAALALVKTIVGNHFDAKYLIEAISKVEPAFGRGETITIHNQPLDLILVKNPSGFRLGLQSFCNDNHAVMIAINDKYADGRDMSWLWDVDFNSLDKAGVEQISGNRAYDMALRLQYEEIPFRHVNPNLKAALRTFLKNSSDKPKRIYCTYTAMIAIRRQLGKITKVKVIK